MDDRDFEGRLRARLHRRFDTAEPSGDLAAGVRQLFATRPRRVAVLDLHGGGRIARGWSIAAVIAVVALVAFAAINFRLIHGPGVPGPSPSPSRTTITVPVEAWFIVFPPSATVPPPDVSTRAFEVLSARLRAFGIRDLVPGLADVMYFKIPAPSPSGDQIRRLLAAPGVVAVVPLPATDYGEGKLTAEVGKALPKAERALFGWEGIASASADGAAGVTITLTPTAGQAFADYTTSNVGEQFAVVIDGIVAIVPTVGEPVPGGMVTIEFGIADEGRVADALAILLGGELPEAWRGASVPTLLSREDAAARAIEDAPGATLFGAGVQGELFQGAWRAVWNVVLNGAFAVECPSGSETSDTCAPLASTELVRVDAVTGAIIEREAPAPTQPSP